MAIHGYLGGVISATAPTVNNSGASGVFTLEEQLQYAGQNLWPGYQISRSVRLRSSASAYFNRTFGTPTNNKIWTYSLWLKLGVLGTERELLNANSNSSQFYISTSDTLNFYDATAGATYYSTQVFRDPSAWYHIVVSVDTTQSTAGNRVRIYVNGSQITSFSTGTAPTQNNASAFNVASTVHTIGRYNPTTTNYFDGYLTEINFIDGQALTPTSFGSFDAVTGVWNPIRYSGTYGNNGFYLNFSDNSSNTATTIGKDYSGNGNNWTPNNISVTTGTTYDSMVDVPIGYGSDTGAGGEVRGNYCTLNAVTGSATLSNANLQYSSASGAYYAAIGTIGVSSGKWYWEVTANGAGQDVGICGITNRGQQGVYVGSTADSYGYYGGSGNKYNNGSAAAYGATYTTNDVIGVALDLDAGTLVFYKNNSSQGTAYSGLSGTFLPMASNDSSNAGNGTFNFGQRAFAYTAPSGFKALCTQNLSTPTILNGANYMAATLYTGNGGTNAITNTVNGVSFQPDFIWTKSRSSSGFNIVQDAVRGAGYRLITDGTYAELYDSTYGSFTSNGFTFGANTNINNSGTTYVGWQWKANGAGSSNTSGSITSTVSANTTAGFSVVTYTGTGANATVGHGLGVAPSMIILKSRSAVTDWRVYQSSVNGGVNPANYTLKLNTTGAQAADSTIWNNTAPTSSVFSIGSNVEINTNGNNYVAYCFAPISGYSAFGSYTGNGSADGPFVYCGFRPRFVLVKDITNVTYWEIGDSSRNTYNAVDANLYPNSSTAEAADTMFDFLSNGFKVRKAGGNFNNSGATTIYAAFAENPFTLSRAR